MNRRNFLTSVAGATAAATMAQAADESKPGRPLTTMGFSPDCFVQLRPSRDPVDYLNVTADHGGGGAQVYLRQPIDPALVRGIREVCDKRGLYVEVAFSMPETDDVSELEATVKAAKECGARAMRTIGISGRRYESFDRMEQWKEFYATTIAKMERTSRVAERMQMPIGQENHKDFTLEEYYPLMKQYGNEYFGWCNDSGNNMSLLDDPAEMVDVLGPFVKCSHIKDMGVEEYEEGFLLSEVPLGEGFLPMKHIVDTMKKYRPEMNISMDFLTRSPLVIPCLTDKYWATFPFRSATYLAKMLRTVREHKPKEPLPRINDMPEADRIRIEASNLYKSCVYARDVLGLTRA